MLSPSRVPDLHGDCLYDCHNDEGIVNLQYSLQEAAYLSSKLLLVSAKDATCSHEGFSNTHETVQAQIKGTFAAGTKNPAHLVVFVGSGAFYTQLKAMDPKQIVMALKSTQVYFQGEYCSYGDCVIDHIRVGSIQKTELSVLR